MIMEALAPPLSLRDLFAWMMEEALSLTLITDPVF